MQNESRNSVIWRFRKKESLFRVKEHRLKKPPKFAFFQRFLVFGFFCQKLEMFLFFSFYAKWIKKKCFLKVPKEKKPF